MPVCFREKAKVMKPSEDANDRPEAKKPRVDPTETTMVKKVWILYFAFIFNQAMCFRLSSSLPGFPLPSLLIDSQILFLEGSFRN